MSKATIYNASAGSGKTYRLAYKYVKEVIISPLSYRNILAVTFTNKATEEMKRRILRSIVALASGSKSDYLELLLSELPYMNRDQIRRNAIEAQGYILHDYSRFTILTIDTFFQRILRAFIQEVGIDIGYSLEIDSASIVEQGVDGLIERINDNEELREWLFDSVNERVEQGRGWDFRKDLMSLSSQIFNEKAQEALGKHSKKELLSSIDKLTADVDRILEQISALAIEAKGIMDSGGVVYDDFKYGKNSVVQIFRRYLDGGRIKPSARCRAAIDDLSVFAKPKSAAECVAPQIQPLLTSLVEHVDRLYVLDNTLQLYRDNMRSFALLSDLFAVVEEICSNQSTMLLNQTSRLLREFVYDTEESFASDAPFIYERVGSRFTRFMIDEFQDTSRHEWRNFLPLLRNAIAQSNSEEEPILIVGDIKQSIYRWRGGDWRLLGLEAQNDLGRGDTRVVDMVDNYRSLPRIVEFNNSMIDRVVEHVSNNLSEDLEAAYSDSSITKELHNELSTTIAEAYRGHRQNSTNPDTQSGFVEVLSYDDQVDPPIIERICSAIDRGYSPSEILILTRTGNEAAAVAKILLQFKASNNDPRYRFDVMTQEALVVGASPVSHFIIAVMMLAINHKDAIQRAIYNQFLASETINRELSDEELTLLKSIKMLSPIEAFERIVIEYDLNRDSSNIAYLQAIHDQVIAFSNNRIGDLSLFVEWWLERGAKRSISVEKSRSAIEVLTIHKAKGLEKSVVIIPYCDWEMEQRASGMIRPIVWSRESNGEYFPGSFPVIYRGSMGNSLFAADYHSERVYSHLDSINLLYVALTRAAESLHIFIPTKVKEEKRLYKGVAQPIIDVGSPLVYRLSTPLCSRLSSPIVPTTSMIGCATPL